MSCDVGKTKMPAGTTLSVLSCSKIVKPAASVYSIWGTNVTSYIRRQILKTEKITA